MFWFDKNNPEAVFGDIRRQEGVVYDVRGGGRTLDVVPDQLMDFTNLPFLSGRFNLVVLDPPHLKSVGPKSWQAKKYGVLPNEYRQVLREAFIECFRVLDANGVLIFKWNEHQISLREVLSLTEVKPLFGQTTTQSLKTHWIVFIKPVAGVLEG